MSGCGLLEILSSSFPVFKVCAVLRMSCDFPFFSSPASNQLKVFVWIGQAFMPVLFVVLRLLF